MVGKGKMAMVYNPNILVRLACNDELKEMRNEDAMKLFKRLHLKRCPCKEKCKKRFEEEFYAKPSGHLCNRSLIKHNEYSQNGVGQHTGEAKRLVMKMVKENKGLTERIEDITAKYGIDVKEGIEVVANEFLTDHENAFKDYEYRKLHSFKQQRKDNQK